MSDFFIHDFQKDIWNDNYRYKEETIEGTQWRLVNSIYKDECPNLKKQLYNALINARLFFGGRVTANTGTGIKNAFAFNCYAAQRSAKPVDSIKNIFKDAWHAAEILKTEGGIGYNFNHLRPHGTLIKGVGVGTPGAVAFMELYDKVAELITKGHEGELLQVDEDDVVKKKIRKGAQMAMIHIRHPDSLDFIEAKKVPNRLTYFNMSVIITDEFMYAVENDEDWEFWFPDIKFEKYDEEWDGDFEKWEEKGYPKVVYDKLPAKQVWDFIIQNTYNRNEPGMYFIDNANRYNNLIYYQKITGTNPCGEISMLADAGVWTDPKTGIIYEHLGDICNLGSLNLTQYFDKTWLPIHSDKPFPFDFNLFADDVRLLVRGLDNLVDISGYPLEELKTAAALRRKIGAGIMGLGSLHYMMGIRYGSSDSMTLIKQIMSVFVNVAYETSALLAKEKGSFLLYDEDKIFEGGYIKNGLLRDDIKQCIKENGLRNSQVLTAAPTGNLSVYARLISGGVEPVFEKEYYRWVVSNHKSRALLDGLEHPKYWKGEFFETKDFTFEMRGDDQVLLSKCGTLMIDKSRGLTQKVQCEEYGWKFAQEWYEPAELKKMEKAGVFATAMELSAAEHIEPFILLSKYVDNSISKTVNLPANYPIEDFDKLFRRLWQEGSRGLTTYREGTMMAVLETKKKIEKKKKDWKKEQREFFEIWKDHEKGQVIHEEVSLPAEYPQMGYKIESEGRKWYLSVAFKDKKLTRPFAIFVTTNNRESDTVSYGTVEALTELAESEGISIRIIEENDKKCSGQNNVNKIARTLSMLLRHNVKIEKIVKVLDKQDVPVFSLVYRLKKFLMRWIDEMPENGMTCPNCGEKVVLEEGCIKCGGSCGWTKC